MRYGAAADCASHDFCHAYFAAPHIVPDALRPRTAWLPPRQAARGIMCSARLAAIARIQPRIRDTHSDTPQQRQPGHIVDVSRYVGYAFL